MWWAQQNVIMRASDVLTTFSRPLWSVPEQTRDNMKPFGYIIKNKNCQWRHLYVRHPIDHNWDPIKMRELFGLLRTEKWLTDNYSRVFDLFDNELGDMGPCFCSYCTGEKGVAYTLLTSADQNFSGDLVRNLVSGKVWRLLELDTWSARKRKLSFYMSSLITEAGFCKPH